MTLAIGCDVANWQVRFDPSQATGLVDFAFQKVTDGINTHSALQSMWLGVKQVWVRGAYHYMRSGVNWQAQADKFLAVAEAKDFHIYALDLEGANNIVTDSFLFDTQRIINYWKSKTTKRVILYTNIEFYKKLQALGLNDWLSTIDLWIANPNLNPGFPPLPPYRTTWTFHQYSWWGKPERWGTGSPNTDEDVFNGTVNELRQWAGATTPPPTGDTMTLGTAKEALGNIPSVKSIPDVSGAKVGQLTAGCTVSFEALVPGSKVATDSWLQLPNNGGFVNQKISGKNYFTILSMPSVTPPPVPTVSDVVFASMDFDLPAKTMTITRRRQDGTSDVLRDPIA
jgi:GH25 family lysozyme M1 (1,4-beta-N-acetylmuramidase)